MQIKKQIIYIDRDRVLSEVLDHVAQRLIDTPQCNIHVVRPELNTADLSEKKQNWWKHEEILNCEVMCITTRTQITKEVLADCKKLKGVVYPTIGWNTIDYKAATEHHVMIVNNPTWENYAGLAEATVMLMSAILLELPQKMRQCNNDEARPSSNVITSKMLANKKIGLIGYGRIAQEVKKRLMLWGCQEILVCTRRPHKIQDSDVTVSTLEKIFETSDVISVHIPLMAETKHLINYRVMSLSQSGFFLINTARGGVVCEDSIIKCLNEGIIKGAALDVFEKEPLDSRHQLRNYDNVILTNHIIGHTKELFDSLPAGAVKSIREILSHKIPDNCINCCDLPL